MSRRAWIDKFAYYTKSSCYVLFTVVDPTIFDQKLLKTSDDRPLKQIQNMWENGYAVRLVTFTGSLWVVVGDKRENHAQQTFTMDRNPPMEEIHEAIEAGADIQFLHYSRGEWIFFSEKEGRGKDKLHQEVHVFEKFPDIFIRDNVWDKSLVVRHLSFGAGKWILIAGTPRTEDVSQQYMASNAWPGERLLGCIRDHKNIRTLEWDEADNIWAIVSEKNPGNVHSILTTHHFPDEKFKELGITN